MGEILVTNLEEIHKQIDKDGTTNPEQAGLILKDIVNHVFNVPANESKYVASLLYHKETGILNFLKHVVTFKEFEGVKVDILKFILEYIKQDDIENTLYYATGIKETCVSCYNRDHSLKVKTDCIHLLEQLLLTDSDKMEAALDIGNIYQRFWSESMQHSKTTGKGGLKLALYGFMGSCCELFPHIVGDSANRLLSLFLGVLRQEMVVKKSKVELQVITGCFRGLTGYLVNFTQSVEEKSKFAHEIFKYVKLCIMKKEYTRYEAPKAALTLLKQHCGQFKELVTEEAEALYSCLQEWSNHINREVKYLALDTMDAVLTQIAICLSQSSESKKYFGILKKFMTQFQSSLTSSTSSTKEILMAIKGYGKFSEACSKIFSSDDMRLMFEEVLKRSEQCYASMNQSSDDGFYQLPMFLESLASLIKCLKEVSVRHVLPLEKIVILLFDFYPRLGKNGQVIFHKSLTSFIEASTKFPDFLNNFLPQIVYQCLIRTCSCPLHMEKLLNDAQQTGEENKLSLSFKTFLPIWQTLLEPKNYKKESFGLMEAANIICEQVYNELMNAILLVLKKLNLQTTKPDEKAIDDTNVILEIADENINDARALVPSDFSILINLVDLSRELLSCYSTNSFTKWIPSFIEDVVLLSTRNPLVSGCYKLLQVVCELIETNQYFAELTEKGNDSNKEVYKVFLLLKSFVKEVSGKLKQFNGDLLVSCVEFIINLPVEILKKSLNILVKPLQLTFQMGLSHYELADIGLNTLERLNNQLAKDEMNKILDKVLPYLDDYLQFNADANQEDQREVVVQTKSERKVKRASVKFFKKLINANKQMTESPLTKLKFRMINFLGKLGGASNLALIHNSEMESLNKAITWDTTQHLLFSLPFQDIKPEFYLDSFLPRVIELALFSSVRQTKVVACELLHALALYMMGISVQKSYERSNIGNITKLYVKVFPAMLKLACSIEQVAEQLFRPLIFQTIHWLTGNVKYESPETMALLDALLEAVSSENDNALREFAAICVKEFFDWSMKQTTSKKSQDSPINVKSLFKRMKSLALHPSVYKRLGASITMNKIYKIFREKAELVDIYALEILVLFVDCLSLSHTDEKSAGTVDECEKAIENIKKIVVKKKDLLYKGSKVRRKPLDFKRIENKDFSLTHVNIWLLRKCGSPATACRHVCMKLAHTFIPLQIGLVSLKKWMENTLIDNAIGGAKFFSDKFEKGSSANQGIRSFPTLDDRVKLLNSIDESEKEKEKFSMSTAIDWLENLLGALDCYCWVIGENLLSPIQLFKENKSSNMMKSLEFFLLKICLLSPEELCKAYHCQDVVSVAIREKYNRIKCTVFVRAMNFLCVILTKRYLSDNEEGSKYFHEHFYKALFLCTFSPQELGFDISNREVLMHLPNELETFITVMMRFCSPNIAEQFKRFWKNNMKGDAFDLFNSPQQIPSKQIISGYMVLLKVNLLDQIFGKEMLSSWSGKIASRLSDVFLQTKDAAMKSIDPSLKTEVQLYLEFGLMLDKKNNALIEMIMGINSKDSKCNKKFGEINLFNPGDNSAATLRKLKVILTGDFILLSVLPLATITMVTSYDQLGQLGCLFYCKHSEVFNNHFINNNLSLLKLIHPGKTSKKNMCIILSTFFEWCIKKKISEKEKQDVCQLIASEWSSTIAPCFNSLETMSICLQLAISFIKLAEKNVKNDEIFLVFPKILVDSVYDMSSKESIIEFLPHLLSMGSEKQVSLLKDAAQRFIVSFFPIRSSDLNVGSSKYVSYITCLQKFLKSMVGDSSGIIFSVLLSHIIQETDSMFEKTIKPSLLLLIKGLNSQRIGNLFEICFEIFDNHVSFKSELRKNVITRVVLLFLSYISINDIKDFFKLHIKKFMSIIESKMMKSDENLFENQLLDKMCAYKIVSLLFQYLPKESVVSTSSEILRAFCGNPTTGKELTSALSRTASAAFKEDMRGEVLCLESRRQYHCAAYNCLVSIISCTQSELKFYTGLLFAENLAKGAFLFENVIDLQKTYHFECELTMPFAKVKALQLIRKSHNETHQNILRKPRGYISSQYLLDSSFSQEVNQFDFNTPAQAYTSNQEVDYQDKNLQTGNQNQSHIPSDVSTNIELDEINKHECMQVFIGVINHMRDTKIYTVPSENQRSIDMPSWMQFLQKKMLNKETHLNIKLFICKLVINMPKVFEPYGQFWFEPLCDFILSSQIDGPALNYFVIDIIVVMLSWSKTVIPKDDAVGKNLSSSLLDYLFKYCHHNNRSILKNNLQVIKTLINAWKDRLEISYKIIHDQLKNTASETKDNTTGLQLLGLVLGAGFKPFSTQSGINEMTYFNDITKNLSFKYKEVFATAAEVCGMAMKYFMDNDISDDVLSAKVDEYLINFSKTQKDRFVICLHSIHLHYVAIVDRYIPQLLYCLLCLYGYLKTQCLQCLAARISELKNEHKIIYQQLKGKELTSLLSHTEEDTQTAALQLALSLVKTVDEKDVLDLAMTVSLLRNNNSRKIRELMYDFFIWTFDQQRKEEDMGTDTTIEILSISKEVMLLGINDPDTDLSLKVLNFWRDATRLPVTTIERLIEITRALYSNKTEKEFLSYATNLMLQLTSLSPDYSRPVFETGLDSEESFRNYHVNFSYQHQNIAMTPLFIATQDQSQLLNSSSFGIRMLQSTQTSKEFTQTMETDPSVNWMNPSVQITPQSFSPTSGSQASSSFTTLIGAQPYQPLQSGDTVDGKPMSRTDEVLKLRGRFLKDKFSRNMKFASMQMKKMKMRKAEKDRQAFARDRKVVMYRKYRAGELPDIKIKHSELIVPLQALSQLDSEIAKLLFSNIFNAVVSKFEEKFTEETMNKANSDIEESFDISLKTSSIYSPTFISTVLDICNHSKIMKLDPQHISMSSVMSSQQPVGILTLEKQLLSKINITNQAKQARRQYELKTENENLQSWLELAKIYDSIDDYDMLRSIFSQHISQTDITKQALAAESQNEYDVALNFYREASRKVDWEDSPAEEEEEYWDKARLRCYENLAMWSNLREFTIQSLTDGNEFDASKIWQDDILQELYLQYYMKSNIKLLCQGNMKDDSHKEFFKFLETSMKDPDIKDLIQARYSCDIALINILQENYGNAQHYLNIASETFLNEWSQLSKLVRSNRMVHLLPLQKITEMKEFVNLMLSNGLQSEENIKEILDMWSERLPHKQKHNIIAWDDIMLNRCAFIRKLKSKFEEDRVVTSLLESSETNNILSIANVARKQGNFAVANQYLRTTMGIFNKANEKEQEKRLLVKWRHVYINVHCDQSKSHSRDHKKNISTIISSFNHLRQCNVEQFHDKSLIIKQDILQHDVFESMLQILTKSDSKLTRSTLDEFAKIQLLQDYTENIEKCSQRLHMLAFDSLKKSFTKIEGETGENEKSVNLKKKVLEKMIVYCDGRIKEEKDDSMKKNEHAHLVIQSLLRAMTLNSEEAKLRFPRLLQLIDEFPETQNTFLEEIGAVPCWMFLNWINQIIALLDKNAQSALLPILKSIARTYPQSLYFPLNLMKDRLQFDEASDGRKKKKQFEALVNFVSHDMDIANSLVLALGQLSNPNHILQAFKEEANDLYNKRKIDKLLDLFNDLQHKLLQDSNIASPTQDDVPIPGKFAKQFQKEYGKEFIEIFGQNGEKLKNMKEKTFKESIKKVHNIMTILKNKKNYEGNLKDFSPWLSNFHASSYSANIEIPGQYTGYSKPMPEYHVNIASFDEKILILQSIRMPKRITIRGDDEKDYKFLVKGGEDLRQDQRLEQVFEIMNMLLKKDSLCCNRLLHLNTYQVIPMTSRLGLIGWVDNTVPYVDVLKGNLDKREEKMLANASNAYVQHLKKYGVKGFNYLPIFDPDHDSKEVEKSFNAVVNMVPWDLLRRAFQSYSSSTEAYFLLRTRFVQSYSCMCISHYVVGVGDRHLSNMLIDTTTGGVVGIDFGHAFGTAIQILPTPELMPFRLTKQLVNFVLPVEGTAPYRQNMMVVMKAFRKNANILLNTMDIFITEPLVEWEGHAKKQAEALGQPKDSESLNVWYPKHKIEICRQKLTGINPSLITAEELRVGQCRQPLAKNFITVVKGDSKKNIRAKISNRSDSPDNFCLTVDEQVDCLIDQATDPAVLSRTFAGWQPFI